MEKLTELKDSDANMAIINAMTPEEQYRWYLRIKESLPGLKKLFSTNEIENAIAEYEHRHNIP